MRFNSVLIDYIKGKVSNEGRYNLIGIPLQYISDICNNLVKRKVSYKGDKIEIPFLEVSNKRSIPIIQKNLTSNGDENEIAMNIRNNPEVNSDYLFASEKEVNLASGENTITTFPNNWNNPKNDFLKYIFKLSHSPNTNELLDIISQEHHAHKKTKEFWEKIHDFINCDNNEENIERTLGFAKGQLERIQEKKYVITDLFQYLLDTSKKESLDGCKKEIFSAIEALKINNAHKLKLKDAFDAFFDYLYSILALNPLSLSELKDIPHYYYSPVSNVSVDIDIQSRWNELWEYITFEKLEVILESIDAKRIVSKLPSGSNWNISLVNKISSKILHPTNNRAFNYTISSGEFESVGDAIHKVKVGNTTNDIVPHSTSYCHIETSSLKKSTSLKFVNSVNSESPLWRFIQLDKFEPGLGIGFSNIKSYSNNSYPKHLQDNIWKANFKLNSKNADFLEVVSNLDTTIIDVYSVNIDFNNARFNSLSNNEILKIFICDKNSDIEFSTLEIHEKNDGISEGFNRHLYKNPIKYDHHQLEYFVIVKAENRNSKRSFCVIAELEFDTEDAATKNSYFEKYLFECLEQGREFKVEVNDNFSILNRIEEYVIKTEEFFKSHIMVLEEEMSINWLESAFQNIGNLSRNIISDYTIKDNYVDFRPEIAPPHILLEKRKQLVELFNNDRIDFSQIDFSEHLIVESVRGYCEEYIKWLEVEPQKATWYDIFILCESDRDNGLFKTNPLAVIIPSFHPLKLLQQVESQTMMKAARDSQYLGCPGAGLIDNTSSPSNLFLSYGFAFENDFSFYVINSTNQYVSILVNESIYDKLFDSGLYNILSNPLTFNIGLFDHSNSISFAQVENAIEDVSSIYPAKNCLTICADDFGINVKSGFTKGVFDWLDYTNNSRDISRLISRNKSLKVYDFRKNEKEHPDTVELRSVSNATNGRLKWFKSVPNEKNDLMVICSLPKDQFEIKNCDSELELYNPFFNNYRFPNLENYHIDISSKMAQGIRTKGFNGDLLHNLIYNLENQSGKIEKIQSQSNLNQLQKSLNNNKFTAVSGIDLDPSSFESITSESLLYDYNTVGYTAAFGPVNKYGYFLIANDKNFIRSSINQALERNFNSKLNFTQLDQFIDRISSNGISNLKSIYSGGNQTKGEIGAYIANHILTNLKSQSSEIISFISPVDPFLPKINMLMNYLKKGGDVKERPDFVYFSICKKSLEIRVSSIEAKFRDRIDNKEMKNALNQAKSFNEFLSQLIDKEDKLWKITALDFFIMLLNYGLNHLISLETDLSETKNLINFRSRLINNLFEISYSKKLSDVVHVSHHGRVIVTSPNATKSEFVETEGKLYRINIDEEYAFKCINNEPIMELRDEWYRLSPHSNSFFDLEINCREEKIDLTDLINENVINDEDKESSFIIDQVETLEGESIQSEKIESGYDKEDFLNEPVQNNQFIKEIKYNVGQAISKLDMREFYFFPNDTELNQLNIGIVGDLGTGKTQLLKNFIYHIGLSNEENRGKAPKFLIFDTKKDYDLSNGGNLDTVLHEKVKIRTVKPAMLPLNIFDLTNVSGTNKAYSRAKFISNIFKKIYNIGIVQESKLTNIILDCYYEKGYQPGMSNESISALNYPTFLEIYERYDKEDSVKAILFDIVESYIFETDPSKHLSFENLFQNSLVISLGDLVENQRELVMIILLILFREYMIGIKKQPFIETNGKSLRKVDSFVLIDEANQIMDYEFDVLEDILLKGREFGVGVILSTQYLSHFKKSGINYAESLNTWFIHKQNRVTKREILDIGLQNADDERVKQIKSLKVFECLYKSYGIDDGILIRGNPYFENFES
jgi:hypothetical protein